MAKTLGELICTLGTRAAVPDHCGTPPKIFGPEVIGPSVTDCLAVPGLGCTGEDCVVPEEVDWYEDVLHMLKDDVPTLLEVAAGIAASDAENVKSDDGGESMFPTQP